MVWGLADGTEKDSQPQTGKDYIESFRQSVWVWTEPGPSAARLNLWPPSNTLQLSSPASVRCHRWGHSFSSSPMLESSSLPIWWKEWSQASLQTQWFRGTKLHLVQLSPKGWPLCPGHLQPTRTLMHMHMCTHMCSSTSWDMPSKLCHMDSQSGKGLGSGGVASVLGYTPVWL